MVVIEVSKQYWTKIKDNLTNKDTFEFEIYNLLINQQKIPENSKIVLPVSVSTADRHKMHILTRAGFEPKSKGENDRYMELFIKKEYFAILHNRFKIEEVEYINIAYKVPYEIADDYMESEYAHSIIVLF